MKEQVLRSKKNNSISLPTHVLKRVGLRPGSHVEVTEDGYHIILTPIDEEFTEEEWELLEKLAKTKGKTYKNFQGVKGHLQRLRRAV